MKYTHLTREERHTISTLKRKGDSPAIIASSLGRSRSTICRELKRNATDLGDINISMQIVCLNNVPNPHPVVPLGARLYLGSLLLRSSPPSNGALIKSVVNSIF